MVFAVLFSINLVVIAGSLGGRSYFVLRVHSSGSVDERLDRIERKRIRLEVQVEHLQEV